MTNEEIELLAILQATLRKYREMTLRFFVKALDMGKDYIEGEIVFRNKVSTEIVEKVREDIKETAKIKETERLSQEACASRTAVLEEFKESLTNSQRKLELVLKGHIPIDEMAIDEVPNVHMCLSTFKHRLDTVATTSTPEWLKPYIEEVVSQRLSEWDARREDFLLRTQKFVLEHKAPLYDLLDATNIQFQSLKTSLGNLSPEAHKTLLKFNSQVENLMRALSNVLGSGFS